ncbi:MAG: PEGA domain-containing protein [Polyangiaceae bacterium]|nr:PEGA domain-containing protein [Polyangiaceae bacterium]
MRSGVERRWARGIAPGLVAAALLGAPAPARAQAAPLGAEAAQQADEHFKRGKELYRAGKLREAHEAYRSAWALKQTFDIAANLANAELQLGMKAEAAEHLAFCIRSFPATGAKAQLDRVKAQFEAARKEVAALVVSVTVEGAEVLVDGQPVGRAPLGREVFVMPGPHVVEARLEGYEAARTPVEASAGGTHELGLSPVKEKPAVSGGAAVPGPGSKPRVKEKPEEAPPPSVAIVLGGTAVAVVGLGMGVGFTVAANGKNSDADALRAPGGDSACLQQPRPSTCDALKEAKGEVDTLTNAAIGGFVVGGVAAVATAVYALWPRERAAKATDMGVAPWAGPGAAGCAVGGRF